MMMKAARLAWAEAGFGGSFRFDQIGGIRGNREGVVHFCLVDSKLGIKIPSRTILLG